MPSEQDWAKLRRMIRYLQGTSDLPLILSVDKIALPKWWIDGSHAVNGDLQGQSRACMSFGKGSVISGSTKQKINTRSLTKTKLVATDDYMPMLFWTNYFLPDQGYDCTNTLLFQDNQSTILLEKNGKLSSSRRTKHLKIRYFFVTDKINDGELTVEYCPSSKMIAAFFTKPLQGKFFLKFHKLVMNHEQSS